MKEKIDYQDYYKYSWHVPYPPFSLKYFIKNRAFYITSLSLVSFLVTQYIAKKQRVVVTQEMHILLFSTLFAYILIFAFIDFSISKSKGRKILYFSISKKGILVKNKLTPISNIPKNKIDNIIKTPINFVSDEKTYLLLKIPLRFKSLKIKFVDNHSLDKFIKSLSKYSSSPTSQ